MPVRKVVLYPAEILEQECDRVTKFDSELHNLLDDMYETMIAYDGVGLAAPQIGVKKQIAVIDTGEGPGRLELINPKIIKSKGKQTGIEGCLSFPGVYGEVTRSYYVKVKAKDRWGKDYIIEAEDFLATVIQHELDHLHGVLFTEKIEKYVKEEELEGVE